MQVQWYKRISQVKSDHLSTVIPRMITFTPPFSMIISGSSKCGKTQLTLQILKHFEEKFAKIYWFNMEKQAIPQSILDKNKVEVFEELPQSFDAVENNSIIILDDLMGSINKAVCDLFIKGSHHRQLTVILILQNIFHQNKFCREISLNSDYIIVFKNPRDSSQMRYLGMQIFPDNPNELMRIYREETRTPHSYIFLDFTQSASDLFRFQTDIFNNEYSTYYCSKNLLNEKNGCTTIQTPEGAQAYLTSLKKL